MSFQTFIKKPGAIYLGVAIVVAILLIIFIKPSGKAGERGEGSVDPAFSPYVSGYTAGVIGKNDNIVIQLVQAVDSSLLSEEPINKKLFDFTPSVNGQAFFIDNKTIEFRPESPLKSGEKYIVRFKLGEVVAVPEGLEVLEYAFHTIQQNYDVIFDGLKPYDEKDLKRQKLTGKVMTADFANNEEIEKMFSASQNGGKLSVQWTHIPEQNSHEFTIEEVKREEDPQVVAVSVEGSVIGVEENKSYEYEVPALGDFKLMDVSVVQSPDQYLLLRFSDPLQENQNLDGLITVEGESSVRYIVSQNDLRVYPSSRLAGQKEIQISRNVKNILGYKLQQDYTQIVLFEQVKPKVRFVGKGNILPSTDGLVLPFEAVSLKAVEVSVYKIFENNIIQFLQVNNLNGNSQIRRVARPVVKKIIRLDNSGLTDLGKWNRFTLDLSELINKDPGAIYQVKLNFNKSHSAYYCEGQANASDNIVALEEESWDDEEQSSYWDSYEDYYYYDDYDWRERDNPCHNTYYYGSNNVVTKNILSSDFGLIAKRGENSDLLTVVTDLKTAEPLSGITVNVYDYQQQLIGTGTTDGNGMSNIKVGRRPFLVIATDKKQRAYLKVDDGNSLSLSNFNVAGEVVQKGLKGFIYGERGVWRPGDSLHISFMLNDRQEVLPETHPVIFELVNPFGQVDKRMVKSESVNGIYYFGTKTATDAPTGNWLARVKVGGATFTKQLKVETIKPNRLKINLDFGVEKITKQDESISGKLNVKWLHGAIAKNLRAIFDVKLTPVKTTFEDYPYYNFDDPSRDFYSETVEIFDGRVNADGEAEINVQIDTEMDPPGALNAYFSGKVFEEGGDFSVDRFSIPYYPYNSFVGIKLPEGDSRGMLLTDTTHTINVVTVDAYGNPVSRNGLEVEIYKLEWRWWWDQSSNSANYLNNQYKKEIKKTTINTVNGKGVAKFEIEYPDWGRYYVRICDPNSNHCAGEVFYVDWPGWAGRGKREMPGGATMLTISSDKEKYSTGENIKINFPGSKNGKALVSIENGTKVLNSFWVNTSEGENSIEIKADKEMTPNAYVNISLLQPHNQTANDLPIRLYGITGFKVENPETHLTPVIKMADVLEPNQKVDIKISEANGKPMSYTIAVVDEGILDLTRFRTPDPYASFYAKEALGVKSWDIFDEVIGAYGGKLERLLAIGGDMELSKEQDAKAQRFKPVVKFLGPFYLSKGKTAEHSFVMPQYVGSVKTMVVAGHEGAYGNAEKATPVRQPLMILATMPRVLGPGESIKLPVNVFAMEKGLGDVDIQVKANDLFTVKGSSSRQISFSDEGDQLVEFNLDVKEKTGIGKIEIIAKGGGKTASQQIELDIRNPNPPVTNVWASIVEPGKSITQTWDAIGVEGTNESYIEVSNIPPINLQKRLRYLIRYPHGCVEQTVSSVFPQLYLSDFVELPQAKKQEIDINIKNAIERLKSFQTRDGGFAYWPGQTTASDWGSNYAGHFLLEAKNKGFSVPGTMLRSWVDFQQKHANAYRPNKTYPHGDLIQAYRLYTLALAGKPVTGAMNRLREEGGYSVSAGWRLAAAYALAGQPEAGKEIIRNLSYKVEEYREMGNTYGSHRRDRAMILETMVILEDYTRAADLLLEISNSLSNDNWMSTQETAYSLLAVGKFISNKEKAKDVECAYTFNSGKANNIKTELPLFSQELEVKKQNSLNFENKGEGTLFVRIVNTGIPLAGMETEAQENILLSVKYTDDQGQMINPVTIEQGEDFIAEVSISNTGYKGHLKELALSQIFPSGWEIINSRMDETGDINNSSQAEYQDIRDDRVYTYFDLRSNEKKTYYIKLVAAYSGRFYLPSVSCEAMYDNSVNGRVKGEWVEVISNVTQ